MLFFLNSIIYKIEIMDMQTAIKNNLAYYKRVQSDIDVRKTKASLIMLRRQWVEKQKKTIIKMNMTA